MEVQRGTEVLNTDGDTPSMCIQEINTASVLRIYVLHNIVCVLLLLNVVVKEATSERSSPIL